MKVMNKVGYPIKIIECGKERIIPYDKQVYKVDDDCYGAYKEFFHIVTPPSPPDVIARRNKIRGQQARSAARKKKPLGHAKVKLSLRRKLCNSSQIGGKRKGTKKNTWIWILISPEGKKYFDVHLPTFCKEHPEMNWKVPNVYKYVGAKYKGWEVRRRPKNPKKRDKK